MKKISLNEVRKFIREEFDPRDHLAMNLLVDIAHRNGTPYATLMQMPELFTARLAEGINYSGSLANFMTYVEQVSKRLDEAWKLETAPSMKTAETKRFGVFSPDGTCYDIDGREWNNVQLVGVIKARNFTEALVEAKNSLEDGAYEGFEYLHLCEMGRQTEFGEGAEA